MNKKLIIIIGSGGFAHKLSIMPGTFGTIEAVIIYAAIIWLAPAQLYVWSYGLIIFFTLLTLLIGAAYEQYCQKKDPPAFILDEIAGFFCSVIFLPTNLFYIALAFILFRVFDIWKPLFIRKVQNLPGGLGIIADDLLAGICANICCQIIKHLL